MNDPTLHRTGEPATAADLKDFLGAPPPRPWYRRPLVLAAAVAVLAAILLLSQCFRAEDGPAYATEPVRRGALTVTVSATGNLQPTNQVEIGSEQSGIVTDVYVDNNDRVTRGQPLARLDTSRLVDTIRQNEASVASAQAQVAQSQASLVQARSNLARQEEVWRLSGGKVPSRTELDNARAEASRAAAALRASQAQVTQAEATLSSARTNLGKATIYSPVTGTVLSRQIDPGQTVAASFQAPVLFTIAEDLSQMQLEAKVDEADVGQVRQGQNATFTVDAFPGRRFPARVVRVDVGANASDATATVGAANQVVAYTAVLSVVNNEYILRPGMTATADIVTDRLANQLLVPNAAFRFRPEAGGGRGGGIAGSLIPRGPRGSSNAKAREAEVGRGSRQMVYVVGEDGQPRPVTVTIGASDGNVTAVTGPGLRAGLQVITGELATPE